MFFKVDDLKTGPKSTLAKLNIWAAAIRWILDWIDAQPANGAAPVYHTEEMIVIIGGVFYQQSVVVEGEPTILT